MSIPGLGQIPPQVSIFFVIVLSDSVPGYCLLWEEHR